MSWLEAMILGLIQGLTEYLPVSSSGHLAIGSALFGIQGEENLAFTIVVHVATVCSTLVILWKEIDWIFKGLFKFQMNDETRYVINIVISMIPIGIVGVFFKDYVEAIFGSGLMIVGCMLLLTAALLSWSRVLPLIPGTDGRRSSHCYVLSELPSGQSWAHRPCAVLPAACPVSGLRTVLIP